MKKIVFLGLQKVSDLKNTHTYFFGTVFLLFHVG